MGKKKENDGNYKYVGKATITITGQSDYEAVVRKDNKARIHRDFKKISHKASENRTIIEPYTEIVEIVEDINSSKTNIKNTKGVLLKFDTKHANVYFDGHLIFLKGVNYRILLALAKSPGELVKNNVLYNFIDSAYNKQPLLNQRISIIRNSFPQPYSILKNTMCIIPDAKQNKGYRFLNLTKKQVEIS